MQVELAAHIATTANTFKPHWHQYIDSALLGYNEPTGCLAPTRTCGRSYRSCCRRLLFLRLVYGRIDLLGGNLKKAKNNSILEIHFYWIS